ncbi:hypothetical protein LUZ60_012664 [Juncus effusus]|nr:hypothetical protein LUZ60_012664 [Juncus effusus]
MRDLSRRYGSLMFLLLGETTTIIVSSSDAAREIMKSHDTSFASRPISTTTRFLFSDGKGIIFSPYGEYWRQMRKICILELLSMKRVRSFRSIREEEVGSLIEHISWCSSQGQLVNLSKRMTLMINDIAARATIRSKCKNQSMFLRELDTTLKLLQGFNLVDLFPSSWLARFISGAVREATRSRRALDCLLDDVINQHREKETIKGGEEQDDLVEVLLKMHDEGTLHSSIDMDTVKQLIFVSPNTHRYTYTFMDS